MQVTLIFSRLPHGNAVNFYQVVVSLRVATTSLLLFCKDVVEFTVSAVFVPDSEMVAIKHLFTVG